MSLDALVDRYCQAWSEADAARRAACLDAVWAAGATYTDPAVADLDRDALLAHIARVQSTRPGARVRRCTELDLHHGMLRFGFEVTGADGALLRHGVDFVELDASGTRMLRVTGFFGALNPIATGADDT